MSHHALFFDGYDPITGMVRLYDPLADHGSSEDEGTVYRDEEPYRDRDPREAWESAWRESRSLKR